MMKGMTILIATLSVLALLPLQVQAVSPGEEVEETKCKAETILDSVKPVVGLNDEDQPLFPTYEPCVDVEGYCILTEDVSSSAGVGLDYHWLFYTRLDGISFDTSVNVVTELYCEGNAEVMYLHHGGSGLRGAQTLLGSYSTSGETLLGPGVEPNPKQDEDHCSYLAQYDACVTRHSGQWSSLRTFGGRVIGTSGSIPVCSDSTIKNSQDAPNVGLLEEIGIGFGGDSWDYVPCDGVALPVSQMG